MVAAIVGWPAADVEGVPPAEARIVAAAACVVTLGDVTDVVVVVAPSVEVVDETVWTPPREEMDPLATYLR